MCTRMRACSPRITIPPAGSSRCEACPARSRACEELSPLREFDRRSVGYGYGFRQNSPREPPLLTWLTILSEEHGAALYSSGKQGQESSTTAASIGSFRRR